jgi:hypothetical protein
VNPQLGLDNPHFNKKHKNAIIRRALSSERARHNLDILLPLSCSNQATKLLPLVAAEHIAIAHFRAAGRTQIMTGDRAQIEGWVCYSMRTFRHAVERTMSLPPSSLAEPPATLQ